MRTLIIVTVAALFFACSSTPSETDAPAPAPVQEVQPVSCGETTCTPPEQCLTVTGSLPGAPSKEECWIPCGKHGDPACPQGMTCSMIHNGPGQVCVKPE